MNLCSLCSRTKSWSVNIGFVTWVSLSDCILLSSAQEAKMSKAMLALDNCMKKMSMESKSCKVYDVTLARLNECDQSQIGRDRVNIQSSLQQLNIRNKTPHFIWHGRHPVIICIQFSPELLQILLPMPNMARGKDRYLTVVGCDKYDFNPEHLKYKLVARV